jgi:hypothetical protein
LSLALSAGSSAWVGLAIDDAVMRRSEKQMFGDKDSTDYGTINKLIECKKQKAIVRGEIATNLLALNRSSLGPYLISQLLW